MKKINWRYPQKAINAHRGDAWWYGLPNSIVIVAEKQIGEGGVVAAQCKINRSHIERWLKEVKPKRKKR